MHFARVNGDGSEGAVSSLRQLTLGDLAALAAKYRPFLLALLGVIFIALVPPREPADSEQSEAATRVAVGGSTSDVGASGSDLAEQADATDSVGSRVFGRERDGGAAPGRAVAAVPSRTTTTPVLTANALDAPDCDKQTGRLAIVDFYAPNCVPVFPPGADNGGASHLGVTRNDITVVIYNAALSAGAQVVLDAVAGGGGANESEEETRANRLKVVEALQAHYETYGRTIKIVEMDSTGDQSDEVAARADAKEIALNTRAFAVIGGPLRTNAFADELAAHGVVCLCASGTFIQEDLTRWHPHVWGTQIASDLFANAVEYAGKRLLGRPAIHAGDRTMHTKPRVFGLVIAEQAQKGADWLDREFAAKYRGRIAVRVVIRPDPPTAQEQMRVAIARFKDAGVTTIIEAGTLVSPPLLSHEATRQQYFPEWVITGSEGADATLIGRASDPQQWAHAFGFGPIPPFVRNADEPNLVAWHLGEDLSSYPNLTSLRTVFTGIHLAGPKLTPHTFGAGLFSFKKRVGFKTWPGVGYGPGMYPWDSHSALVDRVEKWWDADAIGPDEGGTEGKGMMRFVDGGRRYAAGSWPTTPPKVFDRTGTVLSYEKRPAGEEYPAYPHSDKHVRGVKP